MRHRRKTRGGRLGVLIPAPSGGLGHVANLIRRGKGRAKGVDSELAASGGEREGKSRMLGGMSNDH